MKKGNLTIPVIVVIIVMLFFAGAVLFGVIGRYDKGTEFVDELLPEICEETGKTQQEYESMIFDALTSLKPNSKRALALTNEMHLCFSDTKLTPDLKEGMRQVLVTELGELRKSPTLSALKVVLEIYDDSKGVILSEGWTPDELLLFARALYHLRPESKDILPLLESIREHKKSENKHKAESFAMQGLLHPYVGTGERDPNFAAASKYKEPEFFVGISKIRIGESEEGEELLKKAMASAPETDGTYESYGAVYRLIQYYNQFGEGEKAAEIFADIYTNTEFTKSLFYEDSAKEFVSIDAASRANTIPDCKIGQTANQDCVCNSKQGVSFLPMNDLVNCCSSRPSAAGEPCECVAGPESCACLNKINRKCEGYKSKSTCETDSCSFADLNEVFKCEWSTPKATDHYCYTKYTQSFSEGP